MRQALDFPADKPAAYVRLQDEPPFDAARHLQLSEPAGAVSTGTVSLAELGYSPAEIAASPSPLALTSAFRIFSDEGLAVMQELARRMKSNRNDSLGTGGNRLGSFIRGAGYRSQFVRDFCQCPQLLAFLSDIAGAPLAQHSVPAVACGINYAPEDITRAVDSWHVDSVAFDVVILLTDPASFEGGEFQYFTGTRAEGEALIGGGGEAGTLAALPSERVRTMKFDGGGYGFLQQGNKVFHRACRLLAPAERVTMVPSFVVLTGDAAADGTNVATMSGWSDPGIRAELARHRAWLAQDKLRQLINDLPLEADATQIAARLQDAVRGITDYAEQLRQTLLPPPPPRRPSLRIMPDNPHRWRSAHPARGRRGCRRKRACRLGRRCCCFLPTLAALPSPAMTCRCRRFFPSLAVFRPAFLA